jgi:hypothetical protein
VTVFPARSAVSLAWRHGPPPAMHTIIVDDLDILMAAVAERGLEPAKQDTYSNGVRKTTYVDPDGNEIGFGGVRH